MLCPRCDVSLQEQEYEGERVLFCDLCWGYWLTQPQLESILNTIQYKFSDAEADAATHTMTLEGDVNLQGSEQEVIRCPECAQELDKANVSNCPVIVDQCEAHGIWLDTGEIKDLQIFLERGFQENA